MTFLCCPTVLLGTCFPWSDLKGIHVGKIHRKSLKGLDSDELDILCQTYATMYPDENIQVTDLSCSRTLQSYVDIGPEHFGSSLDSRTSRNSHVMTYWCGAQGAISGLDFHPAFV